MGGIVLGIDGGGTKTRVVAVDSGARIPPESIASAESGPCNIAAISVAEALGNVADGVLKLGVDTEAITAACAGIAGFSFEERRRDFMSGLTTMLPNAIVTVVPDFLAAHIGATGGGLGVTAIAGTGSVAYGRNNEGREHRAGGYGYLIDDIGSGYGIGRRAIAAVLASGDGSGPATDLARLLQMELGSIVPSYLIEGIYGGRLDRVRIASLAVQVTKAALAGDSVAHGILGDAARAQATAVLAVCDRLFDRSVSFPVALFGSVWNAGSPIIEPFTAAVTEKYPNASIQPSILDAAVGAAIHAQRQLNESAGA